MLRKSWKRDRPPAKSIDVHNECRRHIDLHGFCCRARGIMLNEFENVHQTKNIPQTEEVTPQKEKYTRRRCMQNVFKLKKHHCLSGTLAKAPRRGRPSRAPSLFQALVLSMQPIDQGRPTIMERRKHTKNLTGGHHFFLMVRSSVWRKYCLACA